MNNSLHLLSGHGFSGLHGFLGPWWDIQNICVDSPYYLWLLKDRWGFLYLFERLLDNRNKTFNHVDQ